MLVRAFVSGLLLIPVPASVWAATPTVSQGEPVAVVELFTSEGCSSCPPADDFLRRIHLQHNSGELIFGLSEHVTYWNQLGWKDPFSQQAFTDRQEAYAERLSERGPYTPQMVVNGSAEFVGGNGPALQKALQADAKLLHGTLAITTHAVSGGRLSVSFHFKGPDARAYDILVVVADDSDRSSVARGENSGRTLEHVSVVRSMTRVATLSGDSDQTAEVPLALEAGKPTVARHLVLIAQQPHQGRIVAAVTVAL